LSYKAQRTFPFLVDLNTSEISEEWLIKEDFHHSVSKRGTHRILAVGIQAWSAGCCPEPPAEQPGSAAAFRIQPLQKEQTLTVSYTSLTWCYARLTKLLQLFCLGVK